MSNVIERAAQKDMQKKLTDMKQAQDNLKQEQQDQGVGVADVVNAPVPHVDTAVDGVRVLSPAKEKRTLGRPLHRRT